MYIVTCSFRETQSPASCQKCTGLQPVSGVTRRPFPAQSWERLPKLTCSQAQLQETESCLGYSKEGWGAALGCKQRVNVREKFIWKNLQFLLLMHRITEPSELLIHRASTLECSLARCSYIDSEYQVNHSIPLFPDHTNP